VRAGIALWKAMEEWNAHRRGLAPGRWLTYDDTEGRKVVELTPGEWVIGRAPECDIVVRDFGCSRRHAKLVVSPEGVQIVDLKSKSGLQIRMQCVTEASLTSGDEVRLGSVMLRFVESAESPAATRPAADTRPVADAQRPALAKLTAALERPPGSLREDTRLGTLGNTYHSMMFALYQVSEAFKVTLPHGRLLQINTVGELLDLIKETGRASPPDSA
jgi:hypothetical protein